MRTSIKSTGTELFSIIERIASTSSKNEKQAIIAEHKDNQDFVLVLNAAINPFLIYGIQKLPEVTSAGNEEFDDDTWLLINDLAIRNLTGNAARSAIERELLRLNKASGELLRRIITKDLKAGFGESSVNKVIKGLIPDFPYMRCSLPKEVKLDEWNWSAGVLSQEKADGMFANINYDKHGVITITSRQGTQFPIDKFVEIESDIKRYLKPGTQSHGEFLVKVDGVIAERQIGNGIMNHVISGGDFAGNEVPIIKLWDQIPLESVATKGKCEVPYEHRLLGLYRQLPMDGSKRSINVIETKMVSSLKDAYAHYKQMLLEGKEGTIIKKRSGIWRDTTSKDQVKLKLEFECELKVVGFIEGNGKNAATFGSLLCRTEDDKLEVAVSGFTDAKRVEIHNAREAWLGKIITVRSNSVLSPSESNSLHSLFLPRFVEERNDKGVADDLARVYLQYESAMEAV